MDQQEKTNIRYDILLKDGVIVDPSQGLHKKASVALKDGKIAAIGENLSEDDALSTFELQGKIVTPGLIDLHCHVDSDFSFLGLPADEIGIETGSTLVCDAGTAGFSNFRMFRTNLENKKPKTEVFCFLNLARTGMISLPEIRSVEDFDVKRSRDVIEENRDLIKGVKIRAVEPLAKGVGLRAVEDAKRLAESVGLPLMLHVGESRPRKGERDPLDQFSREAVSMLGKGDILSHYLTWEPGRMILEDGAVYPELPEAKKRGVILDACHGLNHFCFDVVRHAIEQGLIPTVISSDLASIVKPTAQSLPVIMSKLINLGLSLDQVVEMTTINPAKALNEEANRGSLKPGKTADITIMELVEGRFRFIDRRGGDFMTGDRLLEARMVFKSGHPHPAWSRYHIPRYDSL